MQWVNSCGHLSTGVLASPTSADVDMFAADPVSRSVSGRRLQQTVAAFTYDMHGLSFECDVNMSGCACCGLFTVTDCLHCLQAKKLVVHFLVYLYQASDHDLSSSWKQSVTWHAQLLAPCVSMLFNLVRS